MPHHRFYITGRVQGVGFRAATRAQAQSLGLDGFVQNQPDGSVYAEAVGTETQLDQFKAWCQQGPPPARVDEVIAEPVQAAPSDFGDFEIRG